jgi:hypothetical protein
MPKNCFILRCHGFSEAEERVLSSAKSYFSKNDILVVADERNRPISMESGLNKLPLTNEVIENLKLLAHPNAGWLCGDYSYYVAYQARPDYDFYWLCEPDVYFSYDNSADFFSKFETNFADFLAPRFSKRNDTWLWTKRARLLSDRVFGCIFPLSRISNRAVCHLLNARANLRDSLARQQGINRKWPNDESFVCTVLVRDGFACEDLGRTVKIRESQFSFNNPILLDSLLDKPYLNTVLHPVLSRDLFISRCRKAFANKLQTKALENWFSNITENCTPKLKEEIKTALLEVLIDLLWCKNEAFGKQNRIKDFLHSSEIMINRSNTFDH